MNMRTLTLEITIPDDDRFYQHAIATVLRGHADYVMSNNLKEKGTVRHADMWVDWTFK